MKPNEPVSYHVATCIISISLPVAYLGGKAGILEKEGAKRTNWHVSYQSQGGGECPPSPPPKYVPESPHKKSYISCF